MMEPWKQTFAASFVAQVFSIVGFSFALPFMPLFVRELGVTGEAEQAWWSGVALAASGVTFVLVSPLWGILGDRYGRRLMVVRAMAGGTVVLWLMSMVQTVEQLVVCRLLQGAFTGTIAASVALVASVTPRRRSGLALGLMQTAVFLGVSLGPLLGGIVADHVGYRAAFRMGSLLVLAGGLLVYFVTREDFTPPDPTDRQHLSMGAILRSPGFLFGVVVLLMVRFSNTSTNPSFPLVVQDIVGFSPRLNSITGMVIASAALGGAIGAAALGYLGDRIGFGRILVLCCVVASASSVAHALAYSIPALTFIHLVFGLAIAGTLPAANALIQRAIDPRHIGKAYGLATSISMAGIALGPLAGGYIAREMGLRAPFVFAGLLQLTVPALVLLARHKPTSTQNIANAK